MSNQQDRCTSLTIKTSNEKTDKGTVVGAIRTTKIYKDKEKTEAIGSVIKNQLVRVISEKDGLYKLQYGEDGFGYVDSSDFIQNEDLAQYIVDNASWYTKSIEITSDYANVYSWLSTENVVCVAEKGDTYQWLSDFDDHYIAIMVNQTESGIENTTMVQIPKADAKIKYKVQITSFEDAVYESEEQSDLVDLACSFVGNAYVWGGTNPNTGADCSGFVQYVYKQFGYDLPRCSYQQAEVGTLVPFSELQPGDLIFYKRGDRIGHVTMYIGDGMCVQARGRAYGICITKYDCSTPDHAMRILK